MKINTLVFFFFLTGVIRNFYSKEKVIKQTSIKIGWWVDGTVTKKTVTVIIEIFTVAFYTN